MIVCTFINGVLDVNILNLALVGLGITLVTVLVYCGMLIIGGVIAAIINR